MKNVKKVLCLVMSLSLCLGGAAALSACGDNEDDNTTTQTTSVTVTDQAGREVTVESDPTTIVSGYYISSSMLLALGEKDNIKGLESKATTRAIYEKCGIDAKDYDKGGIGGYGTKKAFETEKAATLNPDLIVLPYALKDSADEISTTCSSPVIVVNPESNELMKECITLLGKVTRNDERATQLNNYIENSITTMQSQVDSSTPTVYLAGTSGILYTAGSKMYQNALITNSKATNVAAGVSGSSWAEVSYETILSYNPDVIVIASDSTATVESVLADSNLSTLSAITNKKVYKMPSSYEAWDSPVPSAFLGTLWLAATYHTGYTMEEFTATTKEFYSTFYGIND